MNPQENELSNGVITLRPFILDNAEDHREGEDEAQIKWLSDGKSTLQSVQKWIHRNQDHWEHNGPVFNFAIFDAKTNKLLGMVEANTDASAIEGLEEGDANVSYGLYPEARGKGFASSAVTLMTTFLKEKGLKRAVIRIHSGNEESLEVPKRCGFEKTGTVKALDNTEDLIVFTKQLN